MMEYVSLMILGYLCGSIPFGKMIASRKGVDIQRRGSGNIGFANVRRVLGWRPGLLTLAGDILKGFVPTLLTSLLLDSSTAAFWVGLAAIIGHLFPVWLRFKGGKGVATGLGVVIVLQPFAALAGIVTYIITCMLLKNSSRGSLIGIAVAAFVGIFIQPHQWWQYVIFVLIACWTLRKNIAGTVPNYDI